MSDMTVETLKFLASVGEWLENAPTLKGVGDSEFYVPSVPVCYDGEPIGKFVDEGGFWLFTEDK